MAQAVKARPDSAKWQWSVQVIDDPKTVNAWCMAGGRMAIYTGLIKKLDPTDDELAQVMGHEIAPRARESHRRAHVDGDGRATPAALPRACMSDNPDQSMAMAAAAATASRVQLPNSRTAENEADQIGIELAAKAGYDPRAAVTLWQKMAQGRWQRAARVPEHAPERATRSNDSARSRRR